MTFAEFASMLVSRLELEYEGPLDTWVGIFDDLGIDSYQAFEVIIIIETAAGVDVPPAELPEILTLGDAFEYYTAASASVVEA